MKSLYIINYFEKIRFNTQDNCYVSFGSHQILDNTTTTTKIKMKLLQKFILLFLSQKNVQVVEVQMSRVCTPLQ